MKSCWIQRRGPVCLTQDRDNGRHGWAGESRGVAVSSVPVIVSSGIAMASIVMGRSAIANRATTKGATTEGFRVDLDVAFILLPLQFHPLLAERRAC